MLHNQSWVDASSTLSPWQDTVRKFSTSKFCSGKCYGLSGASAFSHVLLTLFCSLWLVSQTHAQQLSSNEANGLAGDQLYFVALATLPPNQTETDGDYANFLKGIQKVWSRHSMQLISHGRLEAPSTLDPGIARGQITLLSLLRIHSRKKFQSYLNDSEYLKLKPLRETGVDRLIILEAKGAVFHEIFNEGEFRLARPKVKNGPLGIAFFSSEAFAQFKKTACTERCFLLSDVQVFVVKGRLPIWLSSVLAIAMCQRTIMQQHGNSFIKLEDIALNLLK